MISVEDSMSVEGQKLGRIDGPPFPFFPKAFVFQTNDSSEQHHEYGSHKNRSLDCSKIVGVAPVDIPDDFL